jgi:DNA polymerase-4
VAIAHTIKDRIHSQLGFTANVGISNCKVLAKMASDFEKPDKVHTLFPSEIEEKMWPLPIRELFSVGHSTAEKLMKARIPTIGDLAQASPERIQRIVGVKLGGLIRDYANGIDPSPVLAAPEEAKGYSISTTLEEDVTKSEQAYKVLLALSDSVTARIRADGAKAFCVAVSIRSNDFKTHSHQRSLMDPTDISKEVYQISKQLFDELWDGRTPLRLIGISMTNITREETVQMSLFPDENRDKARKLDKAYDAINSKFGSATIVRGTSMKSNLNVGKKYQAQIEQKKK